MHIYYFLVDRHYIANFSQHRFQHSLRTLNMESSANRIDERFVKISIKICFMKNSFRFLTLYQQKHANKLVVYVLELYIGVSNEY